MIGPFEMEDEKSVDDTVVWVPLNHPGWNRYDEIDDLPYQLRLELAHFSGVHKDLEPQRSSAVRGFSDRARALEELDVARRRYREHQEQPPGDG